MTGESEVSKQPSVGIPPFRQRPGGLSSETPLTVIYEIQAFFKELRNQPYMQVAGDRADYAWQNMSRFRASSAVMRDGEISSLPERTDYEIGALAFEIPNGPATTVEEYFAKSTMDAMIVIRRGAIVHERYKTMRPFDKHNWFSSGKTIAATLIALLEEEGRVDVGQPVSSYLTELHGSAWDTVAVRDALDMATGLDSTEHEEPGDDARINPERRWFQWAVALGVFPDAQGRGEAPFDVLRRMQRTKPPRSAFEYNSINSWVLELIVERIAGMPLCEVFGERIWRKIGAQADGYMFVTPDGYPLAFAFTSSCLRDLARFGMIFTPSWSTVSSERIISDSILGRIQHGGDPAIYDRGFVGKEVLAAIPDSRVSNSYQWDVVFEDGDFYKEGVGGQGLYISPARDLVLAWFSTGKTAELTMGRAIATSIPMA